MKRLDNKIAIVTGASKGIGAGIPNAFGAEGAAVAVNYARDHAMTQAGSPDPRIDLVCITSSCPRQFLQSVSSQVGSGFTSLVALASNATTITLRYRRAGAVHSIISRHRIRFASCPLYPRKRTSPFRTRRHRPRLSLRQLTPRVGFEPTTLGL
jgi:NAD(P)-dependent dehydrogenase (short-subunit alcohol dehydrogenase family)